MWVYKLWFLLLAAMVCAGYAHAQESHCLKGVEMKLGSPFVSHAVFQQQNKIAIWGLACKGDRVAAELNGKTAETLTEDNGYFRLYLPEMPAGGPYIMTVKNRTTGDVRKLEDILIGEVWLCSGQSNMVMPLSKTDKKQIADFNQRNQGATSQVRFFQVPDLVWANSMPENALKCSAVAAWFATQLHHELKVPVGVVIAAWNGSRIESWIGTGADANAEPIAFLPPYVEYPEAETIAGFAQTPTTDWIEMSVPGNWGATAKDHGKHGAVWFRKDIAIPDDWLGEELVLRMAGVDKEDVTFFNGQQIGKTGGNFDHSFWNKPREYAVPASLVNRGGNQIAVRAYAWCFCGGFPGKPEGYRLEQKAHPEKYISLGGNWKQKQEFGFDGLTEETPDSLYKHWLKPVMPYSLRGILWYQGCSNGSENETYFEKTKQLVENWRKQWNANLPYYMVQISNNGDIGDNPTGGEGFAQVREAEVKVLKRLPNIGLAVSIDIGESDDIHPKNKEDVANRLVLLAMAKEYGREVEYSGPLYKDLKIEGDKIRVMFDHAESGLMVGNKAGRTPVQEVKDGKLRQFAIAGNDKKWFWAKAVVDGAAVLVSSDKVMKPVAVRYAFRQNPAGCNLYNRAGLPASPFRTDDWTE